ncbi:MAG: acyl-CoA dehydratase activase-related protein [Dehalococcoidales bacterium]|nr:acyl-CoA dehydratase activase-related protein [Dehalococcoidales bacterium]
MKVGIPRGLFYYQYYPMLMAFFQQLGAEVVVSPPTTKDTVDAGCRRLVNDICIPVKVFTGHVHFLADKCDYMFLPSIRSVEPRVFNCPKFIGLPDLMKACVPECPPILAPEIDIDKGIPGLFQAVNRLGYSFTQDRLKIKTAAERAWKQHQLYQTQLCSTKYVPTANTVIHVALIGHPYLLHDEFVNYNLVFRLQGMGVRCSLPESVDDGNLCSSLSDLVGSPYWTCEKEILGAGSYFLKNGIDAIILVSAFGCGPDSLMMELLQRAARQHDRPFLNLVLDEHTAGTGLVTRLEAFIDMINRVKQNRFKPENTYLPRKEQKTYRIGAFCGPNFGHLSVAVRTTAEMLNVRLIMPPVTKHTLSLGSRYSPEFACLPFKVMLGTFIEALNLGADTLWMLTSFNACRVGYYSKVQERILRDLGYDFQFLRFHSSKRGLKGVLEEIKRVANEASWPTIISAYRLGTAKLKTMDDIERKVQKLRAVEMEKGASDRVYRQAIKAIDESSNISCLKNVARESLNRLGRVPCDSRVKPIKVGIVGEIFVIMEPFINMNLEVELGKLGVEVRRTRSNFFSEYTKFGSFNVLNEEKKKLKKFAYPYLEHDVGGHCLESIGEKVYLTGKYDGIIHLVPFTCMPEAIARSIMLSTREDIPVLSIICDEQTGQAGLSTRLEAFVDLLKYRRRVRQQDASSL